MIGTTLRFFRKDVLIIGSSEVEAALNGREQCVLDAVQEAYKTHARGASSLPHSSFLRFPDRDKDRIICLPAYLGGDYQLAAVKWIASMPDNVFRGMERASAVAQFLIKVWPRVGRMLAFDLNPARAILSNHNIVDDLDHVNRAATSIHLASEQEGHTDFVHGSLGDILLGELKLPERDHRKVVFSPFGLGVLDLAVADLVQKTLAETGGGTLVKSFLP